MVQQSLANGIARTEDDVDDAFGQASVIQRLDEAQRAQGSIAGGLDDDGITRDERREHFPGWDGDGKVPRRDAGDDANRITYGNARFVGQFHGDAVAEEATSFTAHVVGHVDAFLHVATRLFEYLAHLLRHGTRNFLFAAQEQFANAIEYLTAFGRRHESPFVKGGASGGDGGVRLGLTGEGKVSQEFAGGRVVVGEGLAALGALPFTPDVILKNVGCRSHGQLASLVAGERFLLEDVFVQRCQELHVIAG